MGNNMLEKLKTFLDSEEGEKSLEEFAKKMDRKEKFYQYWVERLKNNLTNKTDEELDLLYEAFKKHSEKRREILWNQRIDGDTSLYSYIMRFFTENGTEAPEDAYGSFSCSIYDWRGYRCEMYCGQGCFYSLGKI